MTALEKPQITKIGDAYRFTWPGVYIELDRFYEHRDELTAEVTVYSEFPPTPGLLHNARLNLASTSAKEKLAGALAKRLDQVDWAGVLESVCMQAKEMYRRGEPAIDLLQVQPRPDRWLHWPYVEHGGPTVLVADGGAGKSVVALWVALHIGLGGNAGPHNGRNESVKSLYLDWETSADVHHTRLVALGNGLGIATEAMPSIYYRQMSVSLPAAAAAIRREIDELGIGFIVVDSLGAAGDGPPEESGTALESFRAIRSFGVPTLIVHHRRKQSGMQGSDRDRVFGSVYILNLARLVWTMETVSDEASDEIRVAMVNIKSNNGRLVKRHGLTITFENDAETLRQIRINRSDLTEMPEFADRVSLRDRIMSELSRGPMTARQLADGLEVDAKQVQVRLSELKRKAQVVSLAGDRWGLAQAAEDAWR